MAAHSDGSEVEAGTKAVALGANVVSSSDTGAVPPVSQFAPVNANSAPTPVRRYHPVLISIALGLLAIGVWKSGLAPSSANLSSAGTVTESIDSFKKVTDKKTSGALNASQVGVAENACSLLTLDELSNGLGSSFAKAESSSNGDDEISCEYSPGEGNIYPASLTVTLQNGKVAMETLRGVGTKIISGTKAESDLGDASLYMPMDVGIYALKGDTLVSLQFGLGRGTREQKQALVRKVLSRL